MMISVYTYKDKQSCGDGALNDGAQSTMRLFMRKAHSQVSPFLAGEYDNWVCRALPVEEAGMGVPPMPATASDGPLWRDQSAVAEHWSWMPDDGKLRT